MVNSSSMSALDAWRATTSSPAELLGFDAAGKLAAGKLADVVVIAGSLSDLDDLRGRVRQVWLDGTQVR
ncbi:amidohydrolase family protein [Streptomyces niveus]|nr:amidohydrolase family protein [Streptomyces niveus]